MPQLETILPRMPENPIAKFDTWYTEVRRPGTLKHPTAVCVSTVDRAGQPEARFVDLKRFDESGFVFTTSFDSPKGISLYHNSAIALTFWWDHFGRQVRVRGSAARLSLKENQELFRQRPRDAQLATWASRQSVILEDPKALHVSFREVQEKFDIEEIPCPDYWGGFLVIPLSIEFLTFQSDRLHQRILFTRNSGDWDVVILQP